MNPKRRASTSTAKRALSFAFGLVVALVCTSHASAQQTPAPQPGAEPVVSPRLSQIKRVCVQNFGSDLLGQQVQEIVIAKLFESKQFSLTEDCSRADYVLKGSVTERTSQLSRSESEGFGVATGASASSRSGSTGSSSSVSGSGSAHESLSSSETKTEAVVTLRIVDREGEIIWATIQESPSGKSKGAVTLAAEQAVRKLLRDKERAEKQGKEAPPKN